jgi:hypothetical protein
MLKSGIFGVKWVPSHDLRPRTIHICNHTYRVLIALEEEELGGPRSLRRRPARCSTGSMQGLVDLSDGFSDGTSARHSFPLLVIWMNVFHAGAAHAVLQVGWPRLLFTLSFCSMYGALL